MLVVEISKQPDSLLLSRNLPGDMPYCYVEIKIMIAFMKSKEATASVPKIMNQYVIINSHDGFAQQGNLCSTTTNQEEIWDKKKGKITEKINYAEILEELLSYDHFVLFIFYTKKRRRRRRRSPVYHMTFCNT